MFISRQKAVLTATLSLAVGLSPTAARADNSVIISDEQLVYTLHTHLYALSPSLPSSDEFQIAAVCFINDTSACSDAMFGGNGSGNLPDFNMNAHDRCFNEGFTVSECPEWYAPGGKRCPYGPYYSDCISTCPSDYVTCEEPYVGVGGACNGKYASCTCTPCGSEYTETEIPAGYEQLGESCLDCDGQTKYQVVAAACEGFQICGDLGPIAGTETCLSGTTTLYKECKTCDNNGTLSSCPEGYDCAFEDCSGKWYITGCAVNYDNYCTTPITDCAALGYTSTSCSGRALRCPYNSAYMLCL